MVTARPLSSCLLPRPMPPSCADNEEFSRTPHRPIRVQGVPRCAIACHFANRAPCHRLSSHAMPQWWSPVLETNGPSPRFGCPCVFPLLLAGRNNSCSSLSGCFLRRIFAFVVDLGRFLVSLFVSFRLVLSCCVVSCLVLFSLVFCCCVVPFVVLSAEGSIHGLSRYHEPRRIGGALGGDAAVSGCPNRLASSWTVRSLLVGVVLGISYRSTFCCCCDCCWPPSVVSQVDTSAV